MKNLKILIVSRTPWNNSNSFGNTFNNLFGGMQGVEIYNICCQNGDAKNEIVRKTLQMSELSVLHSLIGGNVCIHSSNLKYNAKEQQMNNSAKKHKSTMLFFLRDLIWQIGALKWKNAVKDFIESVKPDVIYLPIYASLYMCKIEHHVINCAKTPVVGHLSDDNWNYSPAYSKISLAYFYQWCLRKTEYKLIKKTEYLEVFAQNMKEEYEKTFNKSCYLIGKGVNVDSVTLPHEGLRKDDIVHFVYTGGIGGERYAVLIALGKALERQASKKCLLDIYTPTPLTNDMKVQIRSIKSIRFHGAVNGCDVSAIQKEGDFLVHVEGFSAKSIASTKMSFSTKIIDYLSTGNVLFAIGPTEINSIQVLKRYNIGVVVDNISKLDFILTDILTKSVDTREIQQNAYNYLVTTRKKETIQNAIKRRILNILNN